MIYKPFGYKPSNPNITLRPEDTENITLSQQYQDRIAQLNTQKKSLIDITKQIEVFKESIESEMKDRIIKIDKLLETQQRNYDLINQGRKEMLHGIISVLIFEMENTNYQHAKEKLAHIIKDLKDNYDNLITIK